MDTNVESDVAAIEALYRQVERACIDGDAALLADVYTDTSLYMPPDKPNLVGKAAIEARYKGVFEERQIEVTYHPEEIVVAGRWAYARATYTVRSTPKEGGETTQTYGKALDIFERQTHGAWKNTRRMFSFSPPPTP